MATLTNIYNNKHDNNNNNRRQQGYKQFLVAIFSNKHQAVLGFFLFFAEPFEMWQPLTSKRGILRWKGVGKGEVLVASEKCDKLWPFSALACKTSNELTYFYLTILGCCCFRRRLGGSAGRELLWTARGGWEEGDSEERFLRNNIILFIYTSIYLILMT